jgi:1-acyl-sn-glycerol-3-phosphate acyltransferase
VLLQSLFRVDIVGEDNFPQGGPLIIAGNHVAVMEGPLMAIFTPWQVEMLGASDIPHEKVSDLAMRFFGFIPVQRGHADRPAMRKALDVLAQGGVLGLFPEGGIWDAGVMAAQTGVAWLSYRTGAPVLPVGFGGTLGALSAALRLRRPRLTMTIGNLIPPVEVPSNTPRKPALAAYAARVVAAIRVLVPADALPPKVSMVDERYELDLAATKPQAQPLDIPPELEIQHRAALAKLLLSAPVLKIFRQNLRLPMEALQTLDHRPPARGIASGTQSILNYLVSENPYLLTYRFGPRQAAAMQAGLEELLALANWADDEGYALVITPVRRYYSPELDREIVQTDQGSFKGWM